MSCTTAPPWRSMEGISISRMQVAALPSYSHRDTALLQILFEAAHAGFRVVEDRRGQGGVGPAGGEDGDEISERAGTAGCDHRNGDRPRYGGGHGAVEADLRAVAIDGGEENLARAPILGFARPLDRVASCRALSTARVHGIPNGVPFVRALRVDRDDHRLAAVSPREVR